MATYASIRTAQKAAWTSGLVYANQYRQAATYAIASTDPTVSDDHTKGHQVGDIWHRTGNNKFWACKSVATGKAVWGAIN